MYAVHRSDPRTRAVGATVAVSTTLLVAWALTSGLNQKIAIPEEVTTYIANIREPTLPDTPERLPIDIEDTSLSEPDPVDLPKIETFIAEEPTSSTAITSQPIPDRGAETSPVAAERTSPRLITTDKPTYPPGAIRAGEQGDTTLSLCVNAGGRVTDARVMTSSGFRRLDDAALAWIRAGRFRPATSDGKATAMCGYKVTYEWRLEDLSR